MRTQIIEDIRRLNLSYFELIDPTVRERVAAIFVHQRRYDYVDRDDVDAALDQLRDACTP